MSFFLFLRVLFGAGILFSGRAVLVPSLASKSPPPSMPRKNPFEKASPAQADDAEDGEGVDGAGADGEGGVQPAMQLDTAEAQGFIRFFQGMEAPPERTIRFFFRKKEGEFYTCHGDDAIYIAQECFHTMSVVKYLGKNNELPSTTVSHANFNSFTAQLLTERQYRVEVYAENKGKNSWSIVRQGSPGNLESFEDVVFDHGGDAQDTPTACCVQVSQGDAGWKVGLAYCDNTLKVIGMVEFLDGDQLCNLEAALVRLGARECVALEDKAGGNKSVENRKVREVLLRCDVVLTPRKASDFSTKDIDQVAFLLLLTLFFIINVCQCVYCVARLTSSIC